MHWNTNIAQFTAPWVSVVLTESRPAIKFVENEVNFLLLPGNSIVFAYIEANGCVRVFCIHWVIRIQRFEWYTDISLMGLFITILFKYECMCTAQYAEVEPFSTEFPSCFRLNTFIFSSFLFQQTSSWAILLLTSL